MQPCRRPAKVLPLRPVLDAPQHGAGIDEVTEVEGGFEQRVKPARSVEDAARTYRRVPSAPSGISAKTQVKPDSASGGKAWLCECSTMWLRGSHSSTR